MEKNFTTQRIFSALEALRIMKATCVEAKIHATLDELPVDELQKYALDNDIKIWTPTEGQPYFWIRIHTIYGTLIANSITLKTRTTWAR